VTGWIFGVSSVLASALVTPLVRRDCRRHAPLDAPLAPADVGDNADWRNADRACAPSPARGSPRRRSMFWIGLLAGWRFAASSGRCLCGRRDRVDSQVGPAIDRVTTPRHARRTAYATPSGAFGAVHAWHLLTGRSGRLSGADGLILLGASLLLYALQLAFVQWWLRGYDTWTITFYLTGMMMLVIGGWWGIQGAPWTAPTRTEWLVIIVLAVVSTYFARLALFAPSPASARSDGPAVAAPDLTATRLSVLFLQERLSSIQWVGGLLVLAAPYWPCRSARDAPQHPPGPSPDGRTGGCARQQ